MKIFFSFSFSISLCCTVAFGQINKVYISKTNEYLHLINDSTLWTSIGDEQDTTNYYIKGDTLFIRNEYWQTGANHKTDHFIKWRGFQVVKQSDDSLFLINNFKGYSKPDNWEDTLFFVNIEKLKEPVTNFKFLKLSISSPWTGAKQITIDYTGKVTYNDDPILYSIHNPGADKNAKAKNIKGQLTQKEFLNFKNLLSRSLISMLPPQRGCPIDGTISNFEIQIGSKKTISKGCDLGRIHVFLVSYLYNLDKNKGFRKVK